MLQTHAYNIYVHSLSIELGPKSTDLTLGNADKWLLFGTAFLLQLILASAGSIRISTIRVIMPARWWCDYVKSFARPPSIPRVSSRSIGKFRVNWTADSVTKTAELPCQPNLVLSRVFTICPPCNTHKCCNQYIIWDVWAMLEGKKYSSFAR